MMRVPLHLLEPHPLALKCAAWSAGPEREAAEAALLASVRECGVNVPLAVVRKKKGPEFWVIDGCSRLEAARAAGRGDAPVEILDENADFDEAALGEEIYRRNTLRKSFTSSQRVLLWIDFHLGDVLMAYTGKAGRPRKNVSRETIFTVEGTAERLGASKQDVGMAVELARCANGSQVPCTVNGERALRDATEEEAARLQAVYAAVREGRTPLRKWLAAFAGMANAAEDGGAGGRDDGGRPKVNWKTFGAKTATSLKTLFAGWRNMGMELRGPTLDALSEAIDEAPEDVVELLRAKLAQRDAMEGGAE